MLMTGLEKTIDHAVSKQTDRRVKRTHKLLHEALIELTLQHGYDAVTIREITDRADVGYATFFRHFTDKDALLADVLEAMKDEFIGLLEPHSIVTDPVHTGSLIFDYVQSNADLCRVLLNSTDTMVVIKPLLEIGVQEKQRMIRPEPVGSLPAELAIQHLMSSLVMLIRWWLDHDMPYPPEQMGEIAARLIIRPVLEAL